MEFPYKTADITRRPYGALCDGQPVEIFHLVNRKGMRAEVITYGGIVNRALVIGGDLKKHNVVLGARDVEAWEEGEFLSAVLRRSDVGRLPVFEAQETGRHVMMTHTFEEGACAGLSVELRYALTEANELVVGCEYALAAESPSAIELPSGMPMYLNLAGQEPGNALDHAVAIDADAACDLAHGSTEFSPVEGTPADYRAGKVLADDILLPECLGGDVAGFDWCFKLDVGADAGAGAPAADEPPAAGAPRDCGTVYCGRSQVYLDVATDAPCMRLSTFQPLAGAYVQGKGKSPNGNHSGILLAPAFAPGTLISPGQSVATTVVYRFTPDYPEGYRSDAGNLTRIL